MTEIIKYGKIIEGNLEIKAGVKYDLTEVEEITGSCYIHSDVELPQLTTIGGYCYIYSNVELPQLTTIGGSCYIHSNVEFKAHKNLKQNDPNALEYCRQCTFSAFFELGFFFADNILAKFISKKTNKNGSNVYKIQVLGQSQISYCIEVDGVFSHGETLKEAKESLIYKISNRDISVYDSYTTDTVVTLEDAIKMYRVITGACEAGTRNFVQGLTNTKKKYTVAEIIKATQGQYGNETFKAFFERG